MTDNKTVTGNLFIVPNSLCSLSDIMPSGRDRIREDLKRLNINGFRGSEVTMDEPLVQVWATSPECDNWMDHVWAGHPFYEGAPNNFQGLTRYWPVRGLMGVEEGTKFVATMLSHKGEEWKMVLTPCQEGYRYRGRGKFEELLRVLLTHFKSRQAA
jgi:hypothetical protein